ncbi:MAG: hypothetical protein HFF18_12615 [Oscillospiraceae bacterium]|nr:hypothetical protein [Oscillospiraceae bacterium]
MRRLTLILIFCLLLSGCQTAGPEQLSTQEQAEFQAVLDLSLGSLKKHLSQEEYQTAQQRLMTLWPLRQARLEQGEFEPGWREQFYLSAYSRLLDSYTAVYLGKSRWWWSSDRPEDVDLVNFHIQSNGVLTAPYYYEGWDDFPIERKDADALWNSVKSVLPEGALDDFKEFHLFTDGEYETVAYVYWDDTGGAAQGWGLAVDPVDSENWGELVLTVLHEYCHYLTLKEGQVRFETPGTDTYSEAGLRSLPGSYLNQFYQEYWGFLSEERRSNLDSGEFYIRHQTEFCSEYASTDPSEDIAECFAYFVVMDDESLEQEAGQAGEKLRFFLRYPEFVAFREEVRLHLELDAGAEEPAA